MTSGDAARAAFRRQAGWCRELGSPFNALLCETLAERLDRSSAFGRRVLDWDTGRMQADAVALRCCGALHAQARKGTLPGLAAVYPPSPLPSGDNLWAAVAAALAACDAELERFLDRPPQTNEVARSALLLGGFLHVARETGLPLRLCEIGASAGLNLLFDAYAYDLDGIAWGDPRSAVAIACRWTGRRPPLDASLAVAGRAGCDANPLDPASADARERLMAYIWPDQAARLARTAAALDLAARAGARVEAADAAAWAARLLHRLSEPGVTRVLFHSILWQYLPEATRIDLRRTIEALGAQATGQSPFAWLSMEPDEVDAAVRLTIWPGRRKQRLARVDYHGRWAHWL